MNRKIFSLFSVVILSVCLILASCKSSKQVEIIEGSVPFTSAVKTGVLENGFTYYVMSNKEPKNRIFIKLVVNAGACNEDEDQNGVAHLIEHMAFEGTEHKSSVIMYFRDNLPPENDITKKFMEAILVQEFSYSLQTQFFDYIRK